MYSVEFMLFSQWVQLLSHVWLFVTPWTAARQASLSFTISRSLLKFMSIELMMQSNCLILCRPLLLPSIFPRLSGSFPMSWLVHIRWPKYWSFNFNISPSNEYSGVISFRINWFDLFAVQGTLKSLLQHHSLKVSPHCKLCKDREWFVFPYHNQQLLVECSKHSQLSNYISRLNNWINEAHWSNELVF